MPKTASSFFPPKDLWLTLIPLLPLITLTIFLSWLIDPTEYLNFLKLDESQFLAKPGRDYIHLGDMLSYYALASFHVFVCISVICYFLYLVRSLPKREYLKSIVFLVGISMLAVVLVICFALFAEDIVLVQLGFKATCMAIEAAKLPTQLVGGGCFKQGDVSKLSLLAWIPTFSGMAAVIFAAAFAYGNAGGLPSFDDPEWRSVVDRRTKALQRSVYVLSTVLVSSTITITLFAHLPTGLLKGGDGLAKAVSEYALDLSTFWGALFSLTLVATFAAPAFRLLRQAYGYEAVTREPADLRAWLHEHVFVSVKKQLVNVVSLLAPLLVGPLSSLLSSLAGT